jgi:hypothetical protein
MPRGERKSPPNIRGYLFIFSVVLRSPKVIQGCKNGLGSGGLFIELENPV